MQVHVVKVNGILWSGEADSVVVPGAEGEMTVLPSHVPVVSSLRPGRIEVKKDNEEVYTYDVIRGGVLEITGSRVSVLL